MGETIFRALTNALFGSVMAWWLVGAVPAEFITQFTWQSLAKLFAGAVIFLFLSITVFHTGLKRYESDSAIQVEV